MAGHVRRGQAPLPNDNMKKVEITRIVDSAQTFGLPLYITVLTTFITLVDGYDLQTMSFVAPELITDWGVTRSMLTPVLTGSLIGMAVGSILLGWLGDRVGRKNSYVVCIAFLFAGSALSANAVGLWDLFAWRVLTGIGLGGITPLAATLVAEWTPQRSRSVAVACAIVAIPLGGMLGAQVAQWILPAYGWRMIFYIGAGLPFALFFVAWRLIPESPQFLAQNVLRHPQLARTLNRLIGEHRFDGTEMFYVDEPPRAPGNWLLIIMTPPYRRTTLILWAAFACNTLALYAFVNWLPTIITSVGLPRDVALRGATFLNLGGFFGSVGGAVLIGYLGSRMVGTTLALAGGLATIFIGMALMGHAPEATSTFFPAILLIGAAVNGMQSFIYTVAAHSYPSHIRSAGVGCAQTVSRVGGVLSSAVSGTYFAIKPPPPVSSFFYTVAAVILVVAVSFFSLRTHILARRV